MKNQNDNSAGKQNLHGRMIIVIIVGIIALFATAVGIALNSISKYLMKEASESYQLVADNVAEEITTWFSNEAQIVLNQKASLEIRGDYDPAALTEYLTRIVQDYNEEGYIYDLYFVNTDNVMSSGYGYIPDPSIDFRTRIWYREAMKAEGLYYSAPYKDSNLDRYVVTISMTCFQPDGKVAGVIALDIFVDTLFSIVNEKVLDGDSYCFLIDNSMGIATHPNERYAYANDMPMTLTSVPGDKYADIVTFIRANKENNKNVKKVHYSIKDYDGVERTVYVSKIECCDWYVVAAIESSVYLRPLVKTLLLVAFTLVICLVVGIVSTRLFTSRAIRQLNEANEIAQEASEAKSIFLANMSHEIRTPINAIIGMNEMVIRENDDPNINDYALDIASASRSLVTIVNDILDFSKIESGKMELVKTDFNIASLINDIANMSESRIESKNLTLFFEVDPTIPVGLIGDEMRIKQIILNLMTNGIKYTQEGFVTLRISFTKQAYGINLNVSVRDTGIGIAEENIDQLYQSFRRFDAKRNRSIEGTGLGLSITKKLVQNMGGFINVSSKLGVGSEFSVCIPLEVSDANPFIKIDNPSIYKFVSLFDQNTVDIRMKKQTERIIDGIRRGFALDATNVNTMEELTTFINDNSSVSHIVVDKSTYFKDENFFKDISHEKTVIVLQKRGEAVDLPPTIVNCYTPFYSISLAALLNNKKHVDYVGTANMYHFEAPEAKVLIVDDNAMNLKVAAGLMKPYNMKVTTVDGGQKAIDILKDDPTYDIVFMDHMMPGMDGIEATERLRNLKTPYFKELVIIALTANTVNNAKKMFMESGFNDFLAKPININFLEKMLYKHLPADKLQAVKDAQSDANIKDNNTVEQSLNGEERVFDEQLGLTYTANNKELYLDILKEYVEKSDEMKHFIIDSFESMDWNNYVIKVHALKSTSLTIGAAPLSELAKELELSGKANNYEPILQKNELLLSSYDMVLGLVEDYLKNHNIEINKLNEQMDEQALSNADFNREIVMTLALEFKNALEEFDVDRAEEIFASTTKYGNNYELLFSKAMELVRNFEYEQAEEEIERVMNA